MDNIEDVRLNNVVAWYESKKEDYQSFAELILKKIRRALAERSILTAFSSSRAKTLDSFCKKCQKTIYDDKIGEYRLKYWDPQNQIMDYAGVRIVAYLQSDIPLIQEVIENMFEIDVQNSEDKVKLLEENKVGYLSIHYIASLKECSFEENRFKDFKCEIQIRTILQDAWAQIFHDRQYKNNNELLIIPSELKRKTSLIAGSLELLDQQINDLVKQYDSMKKGITCIEYQRLLDNEIEADELTKYFIVKFENKANKFYNSQYCVQLLKKMGMNTIRELDNAIHPQFVERIKLHMRQLTIDKLIMYILIVFNESKYFSNCGDNRIKEISKESYELLNEFVDMEKICSKNNISCP